jgi:hypothetical protein
VTGTKSTETILTRRSVSPDAIVPPPPFFFFEEGGLCVKIFSNLNS